MLPRSVPLNEESFRKINANFGSRLKYEKDPSILLRKAARV